jgi:uncharacterized protein YjiS (DUF1127 family)
MREAASFIASQSGGAASGILPALIAAIRSASQAWRARRKLSRLLDMDDHMLNDVGVCREDVRWALDLPFSYDPGLELQRRALRNRAQGWRG